VSTASLQIHLASRGPACRRPDRLLGRAAPRAASPVVGRSWRAGRTALAATGHRPAGPRAALLAAPGAGLSWWSQSPLVRPLATCSRPLGRLVVRGVTETAKLNGLIKRNDHHFNASDALI